jgi:glycine/D-amino acid oxidase-like deaminating enzyme
MWVLISGAGVIGASIACFPARRGVGVTAIERRAGDLHRARHNCGNQVPAGRDAAGVTAGSYCSRHARLMLSRNGCMRYASGVRSPVLIMTSAGMPGWSFRPPSRSSSRASISICAT